MASSIPLSGTGTILSTAGATGQLVANPSNLVFGSVQVGSSQTLPASLTNSGGSSATIDQPTTTGSGFSMSGLTSLTLAAGQSVTFGVTFAPQSAGSTSGSISINSRTPTPTLTMSLTGTGSAQGQLGLTPLSADFGSVTVGTRQNQTATLTAIGSSVTVSSANGTNAEFSVGGIALPLTLAAGQSIQFALMFSPQMAGTASATVSFASDAANSIAAALTGTGVAPPQHNVSLSWNDASAVVGYNVYRGNQPGGPYSKINSVLDASSVYADSSVQAGQTYYYVTTSVDSSAAESSYSNEVQALIPSP